MSKQTIRDYEDAMLEALSHSDEATAIAISQLLYAAILADLDERDTN